MDFHPPQGAHTSYLRTLSMIVDLRGLSRSASQDISFKGAAHLTSNFVSVNTLKQFFLLRLDPLALIAAFAVRFRRTTRSKRGANCTSCCRSVKPCEANFPLRPNRIPAGMSLCQSAESAAQRRAAHPTAYFRSVKPRATTFCRAAPTSPKSRPFALPPDRAAQRRGANSTSDLRSVKPPDGNLPAGSYGHRVRRSSSARARTRACRSAADARRRPAAHGRDPPPPRHRSAPHARPACA